MLTAHGTSHIIKYVHVLHRTEIPQLYMKYKLKSRIFTVLMELMSIVSVSPGKGSLSKDCCWHTQSSARDCEARCDIRDLYVSKQSCMC